MADYPVSHPELPEGLRVRIPAMGPPYLLVGESKIKSSGRSKFTVPTDSGPLEIQLSQNFLQGTAHLQAGALRIPVWTPPPLWLAFFAWLPLILVMGGFLGGLLGAIAAAASMPVVRSDHPTPVKVFVVLGATGAAAMVYSLVVLFAFG